MRNSLLVYLLALGLTAGWPAVAAAQDVATDAETTQTEDGDDDSGKLGLAGLLGLLGLLGLKRRDREHDTVGRTRVETR